MTSEDYRRLERLRDLKFDKLSILCEYENLNSLHEVQIEAALDLKLVDNLLKEDYNRYCGIHNLLHNFVWYTCYSDGKTEPYNLWEDDPHGICYFDIMKRIQTKFIKE